MSYKYETARDSPNFTPASQSKAVFGYDRIIEGITLHYWGAGNPLFDDVRNYLCRPGGNTSAHYVASGSAGRRVACIINPGDVAWATGSAWGNARTINIECDPRATDEDVDLVAELVADIRSAYGDVPLYWHNYFVPTQCPGPYQNLVDRIDKLSYEKVSHDEWGQVTNKTVSAPAPAPVPAQTPTTTPTDTLYKLSVDGKQVAAYSTEANAWKGYVEYGKKGTIKQGGKDITASLVSKYTTPSPTTTDTTGTTLPDSGKPVAEKDDYTALLKENNGLLKAILQVVTEILAKIKSVFK